MTLIRSAICLVRGHDDIAVKVQRIAPTPGGMLPTLDGYVVYEPDPNGGFRACRRCRRVADADS